MKAGRYDINLQRIGMKRRRKEVRFMRLMTGMMCLFLAVTLIFQDNMNQYQMEMNYNSYGKWLIRERFPVADDSECKNHPYLQECGRIWSGSTMYRPEGEDAPEELEIDPADAYQMSGKILGTLDTDIIASGNLELYEGKFPEKPDEIVMELSALQAFGYNYDLGQEIRFYVSESEDVVDLIRREEMMKLHLVSFTLVGTLQSYTTAWNGGDDLPNAVIQEEAFESLVMQKQGYQYYQIKEEYVDADVCEFATDVMDNLRQRILEKSGSTSPLDLQEMGYETNYFAYSNPFWSNKTLYRNMTFILIVLGSAIMGYLMSVYLGKRKKYYLRLREIGATLGQVLRMSVYECIGSVVGTAFVSLVIAYGLSVLVVWLVADGAGIPFFYVYRWQTLLWILLSIAAVLGISFVCSWALLGSNRITEKRGRLSGYSAWRLRKRAQKHKRLSVREWEKRFRLCHPVSVVLLRLIGIGVCVCMLACLMQIHGRVLSYRFVNLYFQDFVINAPMDSRSIEPTYVPVTPSYIDEYGTKRNEYYAGTSESIVTMRKGIPEAVIKDIRGLKGIKHIDYMTKDVTHIFDWEGKGSSEYYKDRLMGGSCENSYGIEFDTSTELGQKYQELYDAYLYEGSYYRDTKRVWKDLQKQLKGTRADYTKFRDGTQVFLLQTAREISLGEEEGLEEYYIETDPTIQEGDTLTIRTAGQDVQVTVGAILSGEEMENIFGTWSQYPYSIVGSDALGEKIAREDGIPYQYNHMELDFNDLSDVEATNKILARYCTLNGLQYDSGSEEIRAAFQKVVQSALVYGVLAAIIVIMYLFVLACILSEEYKRKRSQQRALLQMGVPYRQITGRTLANGVREGLYLLIGIPLIYLVWCFKLRADWNAENIDGITSVFFGYKMIYDLNEKKYILYKLLDEVNVYWVVISAVSLGLFMVVMHLLIAHSAQNGGEGHE